MNKFSKEELDRMVKYNKFVDLIGRTNANAYLEGIITEDEAEHILRMRMMKMVGDKPTIEEVEISMSIAVKLKHYGLNPNK